MKRFPHLFPAALRTSSVLLAFAAGAEGAVVPASLHRSRSTGSVTITATGTAATLDGKPFPLGAATVVRDFGYHELTVTDGAVTTYGFIVRNPERGSTEDGIPTMRLQPLVNDAPSAFANGELRVMAPAVYPRGLPLPVALRLTKGAAFGESAGDPLFLNGIARAGNHLASPVQLRRGWGSTVLTAAAEAGSRDFDAALHGLAATAPVRIEDSTLWVEKGGDLAGAEEWGANARIFLTSTLKLSPGASLTIGPGAVVRCAPGVQIWVRPGATVAVNGTVTEPAVFVPDNTAQPWGGIWLQPQSGGNVARFTATGALFCSWGADDNWFTTPAGEPARTFPRHREQEPCVAVAAGAVCSLTDCALVGPAVSSHKRGAAFASNGGRLRITRTLVQRCITGGEQENCTELEIHSSAFLECLEPGVDPDGDTFTDADNDGLYLVPKAGNTYRLSKCVFGWVGDDGIDTGADGPGSVIVTGSWFETCTHEAISNSGVDRVPQLIGGVMFNNGQGMECGYGAPHSLVRDSALIGNMVGARFGDNYGNNSGTTGTSGTNQFIGDITVENSLSLYNGFHDVWAMDFSRWTPSNERLVLKNSKITNVPDLAAQNGAEDSGNAEWNPAADGGELARFMPVPGANVGVDFTLPPARQATLAEYPGAFDVRLSTFSRHEVSLRWRVAAKTDLHDTAETEIASGVLTWQPGETVRRISAPLPAGGRAPALVTVSLLDPAKAEVTGAPLWFFAAEQGPPTETLVPRASAGWSVFSKIPANPADHTAPWPPVDAASAAWTGAAFVESADWRADAVAPIGWGTIGSPAVTLGTAITERPITSYYRKTFTVSDPAALRSLVLESMADDGSAVYLNGARVSPAAWGLDASAPIFYDTLSSRYQANGANEGAYFPLTLTGASLPALLAAPALNVLAVEVHQDSAGSGDSVMDASLSAVLGTDAADGWGVAEINGSAFLYWTDPAWAPESSPTLDAASWRARPDLTSPFPLSGTEARLFFRLRR